MSTLDYHIHTIVSTDADYTPAEIIAMAKENGVKTLAITDHNNVASIAEAMQLGAQNGIRVIPGIEIDCEFEGVGLHMTAYQIDYTDPRYDALFHYYYDQSVENTWKAKHQFCEAMHLDLPDAALKSIAKDNILVPEDIGAYLLSHAEFDGLAWLDPYREGGSRSDNPNVNFSGISFHRENRVIRPDPRRRQRKLLNLSIKPMGQRSLLIQERISKEKMKF